MTEPRTQESAPIRTRRGALALSDTTNSERIGSHPEDSRKAKRTTETSQKEASSQKATENSTSRINAPISTYRDHRATHETHRSTTENSTSNYLHTLVCPPEWAAAAPGGAAGGKEHQ